MAITLRRLIRLVALLLVVFLLTVIAGGIYFRGRMRASLPMLDGTLAVDGLDAAVTVERDGLGVPTIRAQSRRDAARALGFLHAQDRFFQMDLQRRQAAGELSALVGARAVDVDRASFAHGFRAMSAKSVELASPAYRAILVAYAEGVNAGVASLHDVPPEYLVLNATPERWKPEDTILTILAMFNTLQGRQASFEATFGTLADTMPPALFDFLSARGSEWDAPVTGGRFPRPAIPGADVLDLRSRHEDASETQRLREKNLSSDLRKNSLCASESLRLLRAACLSDEEAAGLGSNNWAVAGAKTASGGALVANDMHLAINVPNIWYRASLVVSGSDSLTITGVTLPGLPSVVVGSNSYVAWGFTNTGGDWSDLVLVEPDPRDADRYLTPSGSQPFTHVAYPAALVKRDPLQPADVRWTIWGPIIGRDHRGRDLAQRWVAHDADVLASDVTALERVRTLDEALATAAGIGIPAQNFVAADRSGRIGWTIAGPMPDRVGFDGSRPTSWATGEHRWNGYRPADRFPRVVDPESGRLWTANAPVLEGETLAGIGEGGYADGIRARVIRDRLMAIDRATPADMLSVQLDDSALFHERWRTLVLATLTPAVVQGHTARAEFRQLVETTWNGHADPASVAYRLVRTFRATLARQVFNAITAPAKRADPDFDYARTLRSEGPLWQLVTERPVHLLDPKFASWDAALVAAVDDAIDELTAGRGRLSDRSWGEFNRAIVSHPLGGGLPLAGRWLNMPNDPLPGDIYAPRAHSPRAGPSERMVVSPGREQEGILHMPTGQSGHPLSPHYADQHHAWLAGDVVPFLPGPPVTKLTLVPRGE